jgi:microcystin-dependent protein
MTPFIGQIVMFGGNFAPRGWALCDGQLLSISSNEALFSLLGTIYGGDGRTTFGLPDLRGRVAMHAGSGPGLTPRQLGRKSGAEQNFLTVGQMPSHNHAATGTVNLGTASNAASGSGAFLPISTGANFYSTAAGAAQMNAGAVSVTVGNNGGSQGINNIQPFQCVNYIIALQGTYPSRN